MRYKGDSDDNNEVHRIGLIPIQDHTNQITTTKFESKSMNHRIKILRKLHCSNFPIRYYAVVTCHLYLIRCGVGSINLKLHKAKVF